MSFKTAHSIIDEETKTPSFMCEGLDYGKNMEVYREGAPLYAMHERLVIYTNTGEIFMFQACFAQHKSAMRFVKHLAHFCEVYLLLGGETPPKLLAATALAASIFWWSLGHWDGAHVKMDGLKAQLSFFVNESFMDITNSVAAEGISAASAPIPQHVPESTIVTRGHHFIFA